MAKIFLSCLGTTDYTAVKYSDASVETRFVQLARLVSLRDAGVQLDATYILLTSEAKTRNWENFETRIGLKQALVDHGLDAETVDIPDGSSQSEFWQFFEEVCKRIPHEAEVYVDLTHGFRTQPTLLILALEFVQKIRNIKIRELTYGTFQNEGPQAIWDLSPFLIVRDWADASRTFRETGSTEPFARLAEGPVREHRKIQRKTSKSLNNLCSALAQFGSSITKCAARDLPAVSVNLKSSLLQAQEECRAIEDLKPLVLVLDSILDALGYFPDEIRNGNDELRVQAAAARWCLDHGHFMQAMTLTREAYVTALCDLCDQAPGGRLERDGIFGAMEVYSRTTSLSGLRAGQWYTAQIECWHQNPPLEAKTWGEVLKSLSPLLSIRNGFDHAHTEESQKPKNEKALREKGEDFLAALDGLIEGLESRQGATA